jgi:hypothetical protein
LSRALLLWRALLLLVKRVEKQWVCHFHFLFRSDSPGESTAIGKLVLITRACAFPIAVDSDSSREMGESRRASIVQKCGEFCCQVIEPAAGSRRACWSAAEPDCKGARHAKSGALNSDLDTYKPLLAAVLFIAPWFFYCKSRRRR